MNDFVINVFVPQTLTGSSVSVMAHLVAEAHHGFVVINHCHDDVVANQKIQELLYHITIAVGYNAPLPKHQEIWYTGFELSPMTQDELDWFSDFQDGNERIVCRNPQGCFPCLTSPHLSILNTRSVCNFMSTVDDAELGKPNNTALLYDMLDNDEFEHLMAYLLARHPESKDVTTEDYVLSLFVEHAKRSLSKR